MPKLVWGFCRKINTVCRFDLYVVICLIVKLICSWLLVWSLLYGVIGWIKCAPHWSLSFYLESGFIVVFCSEQLGQKQTKILKGTPMYLTYILCQALVFSVMHLLDVTLRLLTLGCNLFLKASHLCWKFAWFSLLSSFRCRDSLQNMLLLFHTLPTPFMFTSFCALWSVQVIKCRVI
jgi:hypothetical protein